MKKILYGTTALVVASFMATSAFAASTGPSTAAAAAPEEKGNALKLNVEGYMGWYGIARGSENTGEARVGETADGSGDHAPYDMNTFDIMGDAEVHFKAEKKLKNGMTAGAVFELEGGTSINTTSDSYTHMDRVYAFLETKYGKVMLGSMDNVGVLMHAGTPDVGFLGVDETDFVRAYDMLGDSDSKFYYDSAYSHLDNQSQKIAYMTPEFSGFRFGINYTPGTMFGGGSDETFYSNQKSDGFVSQAYMDQAISAAVSFSKEMKNMTVNASFAAHDIVTKYRNSDNGEGDKMHTNFYTLGANVATGPITVGGAVSSVQGQRGTAQEGADFMTGIVYNLGVAYEQGPFGVSVAYHNSRTRAIDAPDNFNNFSMAQLSGRYNLDKGVNLFATLASMEFINGSQFGNNLRTNRGITGAAGLTLDF